MVSDDSNDTICAGTQVSFTHILTNLPTGVHTETAWYVDGDYSSAIIGDTLKISRKIEYSINADVRLFNAANEFIGFASDVNSNNSSLQDSGQKIGMIFNSLDTAAYTITGNASRWNFEPNYIEVSGGSSNLNNYISLPWSGLTNSNLTVRLIPVLNGAGFVLGNNRCYALFDCSGGAGRGKISIRSSSLTLAISSEALSFANGDTLTVKLCRFQDSICFTVYKGTDSVSVSHRYSLSVGTASNMWPQTTTTPMSLYAWGGTQRIVSVQYSSDAYAQNKLFLIGDSFADGLFTGSFKNSFSSLLIRNCGQRMDYLAGIGNRLSSFQSRFNEVRLYHPEYVLIELGINDETVTTTSQFVSNFQGILDSVTSIGAAPIIINIPPHAILQRQVKADSFNLALQSNFAQYPIIDISGVLIRNGIRDGNLIADDTHYNAYGHELIYRAIKRQLHKMGFNFPVNTTSIAVNTLLTPYFTYTTASGSSKLCEGDEVTFTSNSQLASNASFAWLRDGQAITGATNATYVTATAGEISHSITTAEGCTRISPPRKINALPVAIATAQSSTSICPGTSVLLQAVTVDSAAYRWKQNGLNRGASLSQEAKTAGSYTVTVTKNSCAATSAPVMINVQIPDLAVTAINTTVCSPGVVTLNAISDTDYTYTWYRSSAIVGAGPSYNATVSGSYRVGISDGGCAEKKSVATAVIVNITPVATITRQTRAPSYHKLRANPGGTGVMYQWYLNGAAIDTAINRDYFAITSGVYTVVVGKAGCLDISDTMQVVLSNGNRYKDGIITEELALIHVYPNPSKDIFNIDSKEPVTAIVKDMMGRVIANVKDASSVDLSNQAAGLYLLMIISPDGKLLQAERIMKR